MKKIYLILLSPLLLTGCLSTENSDDLKEWIKMQSQDVRGKIDQLPEVKPNSVVNFEVKQNPFVMKEVASLIKIAKNKLAPNLERRREPMESYNLEHLKMIGFLQKDNKPTAILKTKDGLIHYVQVGNYMGMNYGLIKEITEGAIGIEERIKEEDEWKIRDTAILLDEGRK